MTDLFKDKAQDWDQRPIPAQISFGVSEAIKSKVELHPKLKVMDFGAGTGLVSSQIAPYVSELVAVDISQSMLDQLVQKPELKDKVKIKCQDLLEVPLEEDFDLIISAMALHHVEDTRSIFNRFFEHLTPNGALALADLDSEEGDFHPEGIEGVFHHGFDREALGRIAKEVGFVDVTFETATTVNKGERAYPIFLCTARRPS